MKTKLPGQSVKLVVEITHDLQTEAAIAWMKRNEADDVKRAAESCEGYKRLSQDGVRARLAERSELSRRRLLALKVIKITTAIATLISICAQLIG